MFFIAYAFKGHVHVFCRTSESCKSLILQDKCNIEIFLSPETQIKLSISMNMETCLSQQRQLENNVEKI